MFGLGVCVSGEIVLAFGWFCCSFVLGGFCMVVRHLWLIGWLGFNETPYFAHQAGFTTLSDFCLAVVLRWMLDVLRGLSVMWSL